jgi:hypothetical protein
MKMQARALAGKLQQHYVVVRVKQHQRRQQTFIVRRCALRLHLKQDIAHCTGHVKVLPLLDTLKVYAIIDQKNKSQQRSHHTHLTAHYVRSFLLSLHSARRAHKLILVGTVDKQQLGQRHTPVGCMFPQNFTLLESQHLHHKEGIQTH